MEDPSNSYRSAGRSKDTATDNRLIFGDNLLALKALEQEFCGMAKCVFIDPPYNTGSAFEHYDDGQEHSIWLTFMRDRLELLRRLLSDEGSLWITIDDNEAHYLKVLCDEVFGRRNFVANVVWQKRTSPEARVLLGTAHDDILVYAKDRTRLAFNSSRCPAHEHETFQMPTTTNAAIGRRPTSRLRAGGSIRCTRSSHQAERYSSRRRGGAGRTDDHADLLYDLATQVTRHLSSYLPLEQAKKVLLLHQSEIARLVHTQM